ncbi:MAG TPA: urease accessory protein UreD [Bryobacteraceae bacterium]|nr:urease accessory protein UreD [Bryobacteraceae bacterium]
MNSLLSLRFEAREGRTVLRLDSQQPPWRVVRAFPNSCGEALIHLHNVSGGVLTNDDLRLQVDVGPEARAQITTAGATRVYRSRAAGATARQQNVVTVRERGLLEYVPDALIPYAGSRFEQSTAIEVLDQATLFWWDLVAPGREAAGEIFAYDVLSSSLDLRVDGVPAAAERFVLEPRRRHPASAARLGNFRYFASLYVCRSGFGRPAWLELEAQLGAIAEELSSPGDVLWGVSTLAASGLVVRGIAREGRQLARGMPVFWTAAKWSLCGRVAVIPRKIN